jgi:protein-tyrosine phosphatase
MNRIDVHSHLLPGVDDGCKTAAESLECARMLVAAGYSHCFCTPHVWPNHPHITRQSLPALTAQLQRVFEEANVSLKLLPGGELNLYPGVRETPAEQIISLGLSGKYILVDMWADTLPEWFEPTIRWLQQMGLTVILAHPERMRAVQDRPEIADYFQELGILLQGNLQCLADKPETHTRRTIERYLSENRYFLLGSDTHDVKGLKHRLIGLENAIQIAGTHVIDRLTRQNPQALL